MDTLSLLRHKHNGKCALQRFWEKVSLSGGPDSCWTWKGTLAGDGYGRFYFNKGYYAAHRLTLEWKLGRPLKEGMLACHLCPTRNLACVNPRHLYEGTDQSNMDDRERDGRTARGGRNGYYTKPENRATRKRGPRAPSSSFARGSRHGSAKLNEDRVRAILGRAAAGERKEDIALDFNVCAATVYLIVQRKIWTHVSLESDDGT